MQKETCHSSSFTSLFINFLTTQISKKKKLLEHVTRKIRVKICNPEQKGFKYSYREKIY